MLPASSPFSLLFNVEMKEYFSVFPLKYRKNKKKKVVKAEPPTLGPFGFEAQGPEETVFGSWGGPVKPGGAWEPWERGTVPESLPAGREAGTSVCFSLQPGRSSLWFRVHVSDLWFLLPFFTSCDANPASLGTSLRSELKSGLNAPAQQRARVCSPVCVRSLRRASPPLFAQTGGRT